MAKSAKELQKLLIFDFDGVLIDSLDEVVLTVYNTVTGQQLVSLIDLPQALIRLFCRNRFHVQPIGDGIPLMKWCLKHYRSESDRILQPEEYRVIIEEATAPVDRRSEQVYDTRRQFIERDAVGWTALHRPFQPLWNALVERRNQPGFAILTNKNRAATVRLCRHFGLNIPSHHIYSGDKGASKIENMQSIQQRFQAGTYYFLDDSLKNLHELDQSVNRPQKMLIPLLAAWGYIGPEDQNMARTSGYDVLTQPEAIALLSNMMPL
ncbi:MAG: HAD family hydrolase [Deltaproteobacteria bacterium]|jgi:phosphoglycolate phosphatase-like HAD superfamily hydrolase|nr:HAD family hydrolase [Deltaproteobacteria bacterium]